MRFEERPVNRELTRRLRNFPGREGDISMPGKISGNRAGRLPPQLRARDVSSIAVLGWLGIVMAPAANAQAIHQDPMQQASIGPDLTGQLNRAQPSGPAAPAATGPTANVPAAPEEVGILFLRADGGDPQELRADGGSTLVFVARRNGEGRAYRNGREVGLEAAVKESAAEIALAQFSAATSGEIAVSALPATAQAALRQYPAAGAPLRIVFSHMTNRADTGRVSDQRAAKILALETSGNAGKNIVALVKTAMQVFGLKSDACDNSEDARCNEPGVREAFAQIKREEAQQRASAARF
jgi:hypothetical protein